MPTTLSQLRSAFVPTLGQPISSDRNFSVLYAGASKSGKTHNLASWPDPLVLYADRNLATIQKFQVPYVQIPNWPTFATHLLPALRARQWFVPAEGGEVELVPLRFRTIVVDTFSSLLDFLLEDLSERQGLKREALWGAMASQALRTCRDLISLTSPQGDHPGCHLVGGAHIRDKFSEAGNVIGTILDVGGRSSIQIPKLFDTTLLCRSELVRSSPNVSGPSRPDHKHYFAFTINPSHLIEFIGDGVGGGDATELPPTMENVTYPGLMRAWGFQPKEEDDE